MVTVAGNPWAEVVVGAIERQGFFGRVGGPIDRLVVGQEFRSGGLKVLAFSIDDSDPEAAVRQAVVDPGMGIEFVKLGAAAQRMNHKEIPPFIGVVAKDLHEEIQCVIEARMGGVDRRHDGNSGPAQICRRTRERGT